MHFSHSYQQRFPLYQQEGEELERAPKLKGLESRFQEEGLIRGHVFHSESKTFETFEKIKAPFIEIAKYLKSF